VPKVFLDGHKTQWRLLRRPQPPATSFTLRDLAEPLKGQLTQAKLTGVSALEDHPSCLPESPEAGVLRGAMACEQPRAPTLGPGQQVEDGHKCMQSVGGGQGRDITCAHPKP
jgi:hypothetical protein